VRRGKIAIENLRTGATYRDAEGFAQLFRQIPAYWPLLPPLWLPAVRRRMEQELDPATRRLPSGDAG